MVILAMNSSELKIICKAQTVKEDWIMTRFAVLIVCSFKKDINNHSLFNLPSRELQFSFLNILLGHLNENLVFEVKKQNSYKKNCFSETRKNKFRRVQIQAERFRSKVPQNQNQKRDVTYTPRHRSRGFIKRFIVSFSFQIQQA